MMPLTSRSDSFAGLLHHLSRRLSERSNDKWAAIGYPDIRSTHVSFLVWVERGGMSASAIATQMGLQRQGTLRVAAELEEGGYIRTTPSAQHKKARILHLTEKGQTFMKAFAQANAELESTLEAALGSETWHGLLEGMKALQAFVR